MVQDQIEYDAKEKRFEVNYLYNQYLPQLPTYEQPVLRIQKRLEEKLLKAGESKLQKYNEQIEDFFQRHVLEWVSPEELASEENQQVSFIPLTYAEKSEGTTKMRICSNMFLFHWRKMQFKSMYVTWTQCNDIPPLMFIGI